MCANTWCAVMCVIVCCAGCHALGVNLDDPAVEVTNESQCRVEHLVAVVMYDGVEERATLSDLPMGGRSRMTRRTSDMIVQSIQYEQAGEQYRSDVLLNITPGEVLVVVISDGGRVETSQQCAKG